MDNSGQLIFPVHDLSLEWNQRHPCCTSHTFNVTKVNKRHWSSVISLLLFSCLCEKLLRTLSFCFCLLCSSYVSPPLRLHQYEAFDVILGWLNNAVCSLALMPLRGPSAWKIRRGGDELKCRCDCLQTVPQWVCTQLCGVRKWATQRGILSESPLPAAANAI